MTTVEQLLLIVDRAEYGSMLAEEAVLLRAGIRELAHSAAEEAAVRPRGAMGADSDPASPSNPKAGL